MIGHYLLTLTQEQEDRVLTQSFSGHLGGGKTVCLVQVAEQIESPYAAEDHLFRGSIKDCSECDAHASPAERYDCLCVRFGEGRVNGAIRNRILANQARRELSDIWSDPTSERRSARYALGHTQ